MNLQKMYALGRVIYVDMDTYQKRSQRLSLRDKSGNLLCDSPIAANRRKSIGGVHKDNIAASKEKSLLIYEYGGR